MESKMKITPLQMPPRSSPFAHTLDFAVVRCKVFWRSGVWKSAVWKTWVGRARSKRKTLAIRETAALGDRRFVSVIQFERQRFLIGSSPSSVTLLSQLPDESGGAEVNGEKNREHSREESRGKN